MIHAYDKLYVEHARKTLAGMLDYMVNDVGYKLSDAFDMFIMKGYAKLFSKGDASIIVGKSGIELAYDILNDYDVELIKPRYSMNRSKEYWVGWSLAYYQWYSDRSFKEINDVVPIDEIHEMYDPFHEMDIQHFIKHMETLFKERVKETNLKRKRLNLNMTQKELALESGIPLRTIQQYEQRQKDINKAQGIYLYQLSKVLYCDIEELLEKYMEEVNHKNEI